MKMRNSPITKSRYMAIGIVLISVIVMLALPSGFAAAGDGEGKPVTPELESSLNKI